MTDTDIITAMISHGGSFVSALGKAAQRADAENLAKIKAAWPNYWEAYSAVASAVREAKPWETTVKK